jgi:hypothetical protein
MPSSGMLRHVALVRIDVSEERSDSVIRMTRIGELGTTIAVTSNRRMLRRISALVTSGSKFVLFLTTHYVMKMCELSGQPHGPAALPTEKACPPPNVFHRRLGACESQSERYGEVTTAFQTSGLEPVVIPTVLPRFFVND